MIIGQNDYFGFGCGFATKTAGHPGWRLGTGPAVLSCKKLVLLKLKALTVIQPKLGRLLWRPT